MLFYFTHKCWYPPIVIPAKAGTQEVFDIKNIFSSGFVGIAIFRHVEPFLFKYFPGFPPSRE
ncbi:MAG: hypothetical protein BGO67_04550 [Alphaproteobacteria bacterium 41-28]|nr:MAG: hypothetical protein BGO67_04550 [Alphaproteobacteria bacterium 41-28]